MQTLAAFYHLEAHALTCSEGFIAVHEYGGVVDKQVFSALIRQNEAIAFGVIEPLYCSSRHNSDPFVTVHVKLAFQLPCSQHKNGPDSIIVVVGPLVDMVLF